MKLLASTLCLLAALLSLPASAGFITMTFEGVGTGTLAGTNFTTNFTVTTTGDTDRVFNPASGIYVLNNDSANITMSGLGTYDFLFASHTFANQNLGITGFGAPFPVGDLIWGPNNPTLSSWDISSSIGPLSGAGTLLQWSGPPLNNEVDTTGGVLVFDDLDTAVTFKAVVAGNHSVPAPGTLLLLGLGLLGLRLPQQRQQTSRG